MAREGTRSSTGNARPRVFETVDTAPVINRKPRSKTSTKKAGAQPIGVTKKTAPKKESTVAKKVKAVGAKIKKVTKKTETKGKAPKAKTAAK